MTAAPKHRVRRGRPRLDLATACPTQPMPARPQVNGTHLIQAEAQYLERKERELAFTNLRNDFPYRPARRSEEMGAHDIFYPDIQSYRRLELCRRGTAAAGRFWELAASHCFYHLTLNVRSTSCRLHHAQRLEDVRRYIWWRLSNTVTGYVRSLHLDSARYLHWDYVLAIPAAREPEFNDLIRDLNRQIHGTGGPEDVRIWTKRILHRRRHIERTIDYCLKARRFDRDINHHWYAESFRADAYGGRLGISRRRIVRFKQMPLVEPEQAAAEPARPVRNPGRPRKSAGPAYRQRRRRRASETAPP